jgi:lipopolysaccharide assembly outer membrane protein LptD (OstA)
MKKGLLMFLMSVFILFEDYVYGKMVVTGRELELKGNIVVSRGDSRVVSDSDVMTADTMVYDKKKSVLSASGNIKFLSKTQKNESFETYGNFAEYYLNDGKGKFWGDDTMVKYSTQNSPSPFVLRAQEVYLDKSLKTLKAYNDVEITTSSGTIHSDNAVFYQEKLCVVFEKEEKRPVADILYEGQKGTCEADKMTFYDSDNNKRIVMSGSVEAKIEMEDKV